MDTVISKNQVWLYENSKWIISNNNIFSENIIVTNVHAIGKGDNTCVINRNLFLRNGKLLADNVDNYFILTVNNNKGKVINYDNVEYVIVEDSKDENKKATLITLSSYEKNDGGFIPAYKVEKSKLQKDGFIVSNITERDKNKLEKYRKWFDKNKTDVEVEVTEIKGNNVLFKAYVGFGVENVIDFINKYNPIDMIDNKSTDKKKHSHYYKDVSHLEYIDIYRFCDLFIENDPSGALHHAIKKLAACGRRGAGKDELKDLREAVDTINRKIEMLEEDKLKK